MGSARSVAASAIISNVAYELRDKAAQQYTYSSAHDELFVYLNKCLELIYMILTEEMSELVATGSGSITTVAGTETYSLSSATMGDFWVMARITGGKYDGEHDIYLTDSSSVVYPPLKMTPYGDRYSYVQAGTASRSRPTGFYLKGAYLGLLPVPDAVYTVSVARYVPNFTPLATAAAYMPHYNLFNLQVEEGIKLIAKNRENLGGGIESVLMDLFQRRALEIMRMREKVDMSIKPRFK
jgi:hypothetical protein